jgi:hypothetical protein
LDPFWEAKAFLQNVLAPEAYLLNYLLYFSYPNFQLFFPHLRLLKLKFGAMKEIFPISGEGINA